VLATGAALLTADEAAIAIQIFHEFGLAPGGNAFFQMLWCNHGVVIHENFKFQPFEISKGKKC